MSEFLKKFIRSGAFISKEINEVRRQPRLVLSLIFGPFVILLLFGVGYQGEKSNLTSIFVIPGTGGYSQKIGDYQKMVGNQLIITRLTTDLPSALADLQSNKIDLVVVVPQDVGKQISAGSQARVPVYFNEVDPIRRNWITYLTYIYTNELNKQTLAAAASQGQANASDIHSALTRMRNSLDSVDQQLQRGEVAQANKQVQNMQGTTSNVQLSMLLIAQLMSSDNAFVKPAQPQDPQQVNLAQSSDVSRRLAVDMQALDDELSSANPDRARTQERIARVRDDIERLDKLTQQFQTINPLVLAAPFVAETHNTAPVSPGFASFYAPALLALLLQHIGITLAALSMVRERLLGSVEMFRVAPVRPGEILVGKYISFMLFLGVVAGVLLLLMSNELNIEGVPLSLGVPILGDWTLLALTLALVVFASVGVGFFIASISKSESQAVQLSMLILLASIFFGGFFLRLETIWPPVQTVSYSLPVTYGIASLQVIMLRGGTPEIWLLPALGGLGLLFALLSFFRFSRELRRG